MSKAYLVLADGSIFEGKSIGAQGKTIGETVFTTGMTGYVETLTDPSYYGQIVTQTFPLIGNYGIENEDFESRKSFVSGYIVRELCDGPSNFRCQGDLDSFLKAQGIIGICGIDTRALTKKLRESGVMNGMILSGEILKQVQDDIDIQDDRGSDVMPNLIRHLEEIKAYTIKDAVKTVQDAGDFKGRSPLGEGGVGATQCDAGGRLSPSICLFDFGAKANIERELEKRGCKVTVVPFDTTAEKVISMKPDGIMLSNGPGDPAENVGVIEEIRKLCEWNKETLKQVQGDRKAVPIFGICLGHQMLSLARGAKTCRLKYGHRGGNHPVKDVKSGRVYITSQNHGYAVEASTLPDFARETFVNLNDGTCEGVEYTDIPAFSVQFHPEACGGPHDTNFLFDRFLEMIKNATK